MIAPIFLTAWMISSISAAPLDAPPDLPEVDNKTDSRPIFFDRCHLECEPSKGCHERSTALGCVECRNFKVLLRNRGGIKCVAHCDSNSYPDFANRRCGACRSDCASCSNPYYCDRCPSGQFLIEVDPEHLDHGRCTEQCSDGFRQDLNSDPEVPKCAPSCGRLCLECDLEDDLQKCLRCIDKYYLTQDGRCVRTCGAGFVDDSVTRLCVAEMVKVG